MFQKALRVATPSKR